LVTNFRKFFARDTLTLTKKEISMERMNTPTATILPFDQWKKTLIDLKSDQSTNEYFKILNFHDLVNEYQHILGELDRAPLNPDLTRRSKSILKEFSDRLGEHSSEHSDSLSLLRGKIEKRIFDLNALL